MSLDLREPGAVAATTSRAPALAADPWDAPYFGGRVYFHYPPFQHVAAAVSAATPPASPPPAPAAAPHESFPERSDAHTATSAAASMLAETTAPARRGWLSRLFRRG